MAFDLYLGDEKSYIDHHEDSLFEKFDKNPSFPAINWIGEEYYNVKLPNQ